MSKIKPFSEIPCLQNDRLCLRKLNGSDTEALQDLIRNERVYRYLPTFLFERQFEDLEEMIGKLYDECFRNKESLILGIYLKADDELCGLAEFYGYKDHIRKISIGYRLRERYWGQNIATSVVELMIRYLYEKTDIEIITASTMIENKASARVLEKNGFLNVVSSVEEDWGYDKPVLVDKWIR